MEETGQPPPSQAGTPLDKDFLISIPGILKIAAAIGSLITFICSVSVYGFVHYGGGWVSFIGIICFMITSLQIVFYVLMLYQKVPPSVPIQIIELVYYGVSAAGFLIAMIISATKAAWHSSIAAACVFSVLCLGLYVADLILTLMRFRTSGGETTTTATVTTTRTTETIHAPQ